MSSLIISARALGRKRRLLFDDFSIPFPPDLGDGGEQTLRQIITRIVLAEVEAFQTRQESRRLARALSAEQIDAAAARGKIDAGPADPTEKPHQPVDPDAAVANALQAFEDGLYLVIIDGVEHRSLDAQIFLKPDARVTFVRLVFLAGA